MLDSSIISYNPPVDMRKARRALWYVPLYLATVVMVLLTCARAVQAQNASDRYSQVISRLDRLQRNRRVIVCQIGASLQGRPIYAVVLPADNSNHADLDKNRLLVLCGQHGDEPLPTYAALDLIEKLLDEQPGVLKHNIIAIIPVVNPDGFAVQERFNANEVDLNRNWSKPSETETIAVTKFMKEFRPHVLIDEHEWAVDDDYKPDCIEVAGFGHQASHRLARLLAGNACMHPAVGSVRLQSTYYRETSETSLAHRWFTRSGICCMLVETSPGQPEEERRQAYIGAITATLETLAYPSDDIAANDIQVMRRKHRPEGRWSAILGGTPANSNQPVQVVCWLALALAAVFVVTRTGITMQSICSQPDSNERTIISISRAFSLTETVQREIPIHSRLALLRRHRTRPSDRLQTREDNDTKPPNPVVNALAANINPINSSHHPAHK